MELLFSKVIKRRKNKDFEPKDNTGKEKEASSSSEDEGDKEPEWVQMTDPYGRLCWQHRTTGQVTYGTSYATHQRSYHEKLAQDAFVSDDDDDEDGKTKGKKSSGAAAAVVPALAPVAVMQPSYPPGMGYMQYGISPVHPAHYTHSPAAYGISPVAMYPAAPWNAMPAMPPSPVPVQVPEYIKRQHAEALKAKKKKEEEEEKKKKQEEEQKRKKIAAGVWERYYTADGGLYWQHSVTGKTSATDPYY